MLEQTYVMLKPDALERSLAGEILSRIEKKGYRIVNMKMIHLTKEILCEHYSHIADKPFFPDLTAYMTRGPVVAIIVEGEDAVLGVRILMGATKFEDAAAGTIRGDFANTTTENLIHGSDSAESAQVEINRFFSK